MEIKEKNVTRKSKGACFTIIMYVIASLVALIGIALLVNNILLFESTVNQAVAQGYAVATVRKALLTSQLLPGMFEPIGIYGGIAFLLFGVGIVNKKISKCLMLLTKVEDFNDIIEESIDGQNVVAVEDIVALENVDTTEQIEATDKVIDVEEVEK